MTHFGADFARSRGAFSRSATTYLILVKEKKKRYVIPSTLAVMAAVDFFFSSQYFKSY